MESNYERLNDQDAQRSSKRTTILLYLALLVIAGLVIAIVVMSLQAKHEHAKPKIKSCQMPSCVKTAAVMMNNMDMKINPCHNFYDYACGTFLKEATIPPDDRKYGTFQKVNKRNEAILKKVLEEPGWTYKGANSSAIQKAKLYYKTCMKVSNTEAVSQDKLKEVIKDLGSWPILDDKVAGHFHDATWKVEHIVARSFYYYEHPLFRLSIGPDDKDNKVYRLKIGQGATTFSNFNNYLDTKTNKYRDIYEKSMIKVAKLLGAKGNFETDVKNAWQFEVDVVKAFEEDKEELSRATIYHLMKLHDLQKLFGSSVNLKVFLKDVLGYEVPDTEQIVVNQPEYLKRMSVLIKKTPKRTLATFMVWKVVLSLLPFMPEQFQQVRNSIKKAIYGTETGMRWKHCVHEANKHIGFASGALFIESVNFNEKSKKDVRALLTSIKAELIKKLQHVPWMDKKTRESAIAKAKAIVEKIGYPEFILNPKSLDKHYKLLTIKKNKPFENELNIKQFMAKSEIALLKQHPDKKRWVTHPAKVNAYYSEEYNSMVMPAGILQGAFYNKDLPKSAVYGAIGMIMGHELTHGFDNDGRYYDKNGNLKNWWTAASVEAFEKKTKCLELQYSQYKYKGHHLDGKLTLPENIADNNGLDLAYKAYSTWASTATYKEQALPALNVTAQQLFFLSYSQLWCTYYTPQYALQSLQTDSHTFARYRIIAALSNNADFSKAYKCKLGSPMNPVHKCHVW